MQEIMAEAEEKVFWVPLWPVHVDFVLDRTFSCVVDRMAVVARDVSCVVSLSTCADGQGPAPPIPAAVPETVPETAQPTEESLLSEWRCCWICGTPMHTIFSGLDEAVRCRRHQKPLRGKDLERERRKLEQCRHAEALLMSKYVNHALVSNTAA